MQVRFHLPGQSIIKPKTPRTSPERPSSAAPSQSDSYVRFGANTAFKALWRNHLDRGHVHYEKRNYTEALRAYYQAKEFLDDTDTNDDNDHLITLESQGNACSALGRYEEARRHFDLALELYQPQGRLNDPLGKARTQTWLALMLINSGNNWDEAEQLLTAAEKTMNPTGKERGVFQKKLYPYWADINTGLGKIALNREEHPTALAHFREALATYNQQKKPANFHTLDLKHLLAKTHYQIAVNTDDNDDYEKAYTASEYWVARTEDELDLLLKQHPKSTFLKSTMEQLADLLEAQNKREKAQALRDQAEAMEKDSPDEDTP